MIDFKNFSFKNNLSKEKLNQSLESMKTFIKNLPDQVKRLAILILAIIVIFVVVRNLLVPADFGKYGHYRGSAVADIIAQEINFAGHEACTDCHEDLAEMKSAGYHRNVACEVCHGPAAMHIEDPSSVVLEAPRERGYCPLCHEYLASRPTGFPQIISASHNPMKPCISCHDPHEPAPPEAPKECEACHAEIARTKAISHHVYVPCRRCHETPEDHKIRPREITPSKPIKSDFCGSCHAADVPELKGVPRIDPATHYSDYVCWQCHYPHLPEAK